MQSCRRHLPACAVDEADIVVLAIPLNTLTGFEGKIVISPVNPIERTNYFYSPLRRKARWR